MSAPRRGNRDLIKALNRNLVLNIIRRQGPLSRTQIRDLSQLSMGAVSQITSELLDDGWVHEVGESESTGGRPQILLRLNPQAGYAVGVKLMEDRIVCAITDLEVTEVLYLEQPTHGHTPEAVVSAIVSAVRQAIVDAEISSRQVLGIGVGLAGVVDMQSGLVHYSPFFRWQELPLADLISAQIKLPVYVDNDVNTLTLTEHLFGAGHDVENFAVVTVGRGIGMGMVLHHRLYQGGPGGAGEFGHLTLEVDGPVCDCGKRGCLEALASDPAVIHYIRERSPNQHELPRTLADVIAAADRGDALAAEALAVSGRYIGLGLSMIVNLLCPSLIVLSGEGVIAGEYRLAPIQEALREHVFNGLLDNVSFITRPTDDRAWARGAAGLVVSKSFESPLVKSEGDVAGVGTS
jgi:N-acetylglucosamine repressor